MKTCTKCKQELDGSAFHNNKRSPDGKKTHCRSCDLAHKKTMYYGRYKQRVSDWYYAGGWRKSRNSMLLKTYGITLDQYERMLEAQGGKCAMCDSTEPGKDRRGKDKNFCVDHDHATGEIRSLLCGRCNMGLGLLGDNPREAAEMLLSYARITEPEANADYF